MEQEKIAETLDRVKIIVSLLDSLPKEYEELMATSDRTGLSYVVRNTKGMTILPLQQMSLKDNYPGKTYTEQNGRNIVFCEGVTDIMALCRRYHDATPKRNSYGEYEEPRFSILGFKPKGNIAFVNGMCICESGKGFYNADLPEIIKYGNVFCNVNLSGCGLDHTINQLDLDNRNTAKEYLKDLLTMPQEQQVREFTKRYFRKEKFSDEQLAKVHLIPFRVKSHCGDDEISRLLS